MIELRLTNIQVEIQESEYCRLLGYPPGHKLKGRARELFELAKQWYAVNGNPWIYANECNLVKLDEGKLNISGVEFSSNEFKNQLNASNAHGAVLVITSAGKECEEKAKQLWLEDKPDEYFFMEIYGSAVVEYLVAIAGFKLCEFAEAKSMAVLPHYSPGYPGWNITDQVNLLQLIKNLSGDKLPGEIEVFNTGMLKPKKSLLAVFGITYDVVGVKRLKNIIPCETCSLPGCKFRRTDYKFTRRGNRRCKYDANIKF
jgi:hypothetical protein